MKSIFIVVIDCEIRSIFSVVHAVGQQRGGEVELTSKRAKILNLDQVISPWTGAFGRAADALTDMRTGYAIRNCVATDCPPSELAANTCFGNRRVAASIQRENLMDDQFNIELSVVDGQALLCSVVAL